MPANQSKPSINFFVANRFPPGYWTRYNKINKQQFFMRKLFFLLIISSSLQSQAQDGGTLGNHIKRFFTITEWGHKVWGLEYLPDDFATSSKKYPVMVFFHGVGETGWGENDLSKLLIHGPSAFIAQGNKMQFTNPVTGAVDKFIVLAIQDPYWSPDPTYVDFILKNDPTLKNRSSAIFYTGLSAGAAQVVNSVTTSTAMSSTINGIIPMSSCSPGIPGGMRFAKNIPVWAFHGTSDYTCSFTFTDRFMDSATIINAGTTTSLIRSKLPVTHGPWNPLYDPNYRETINGKSMNIYEWALSKMPNQVVTIPPSGDPTIIFTLTDITGKTYKIMSNGTWY